VVLELFLINMKNIYDPLAWAINETNKVMGTLEEKIRHEVEEEQAEDALAKEEELEENRCGKPHNNNEATCLECEVIKHNL
jgi:hypothetical protein